MIIHDDWMIWGTPMTLETMDQHGRSKATRASIGMFHHPGFLTNVRKAPLTTNFMYSALDSCDPQIIHCIEIRSKMTAEHIFATPMTFGNFGGSPNCLVNIPMVGYE